MKSLDRGDAAAVPSLPSISRWNRRLRLDRRTPPASSPSAAPFSGVFFPYSGELTSTMTGALGYSVSPFTADQHCRRSPAGVLSGRESHQRRRPASAPSVGQPYALKELIGGGKAVGRGSCYRQPWLTLLGGRRLAAIAVA